MFNLDKVFQINSRVRVRVNSECPYYKRGAEMFDGATGTIDMIVSWPEDGHIYYVKFDDPELQHKQGLGLRLCNVELEECLV